MNETNQNEFDDFWSKNWLLKSNFGTFWHLPIRPAPHYPNPQNLIISFGYVDRLKSFQFCTPSLKLGNLYYHSLEWLVSFGWSSEKWVKLRKSDIRCPWPNLTSARGYNGVREIVISLGTLSSSFYIHTVKSRVLTRVTNPKNIFCQKVTVHKRQISPP